MFKNFKIIQKMTFLFLIPLGGMLFVVIFSYLSTKSSILSLNTSLYVESFQTVSLVLNADRDFYQALTAMQSLIFTGRDDPDFQSYADSFNENSQQTEDRTKLAKKIIDKEKDIFLTIMHADSKKDIFYSFGSFEKEFPNWKQSSIKLIQDLSEGKQKADKALETLEGIMVSFNIVRTSLNEIGEIIEQYAQYSTDYQLDSFRKKNHNRLFCGIYCTSLCCRP